MVERVADRAHAAIHHVRRRDHVYARAGQGNAGTGQQFERGIVDNFVVSGNRRGRSNGSPERLRMGSPYNPAMAMRHVFAQAHIAHDDELRDFALDGAGSLLHDSVFRPRARSQFIFLFRQTKQDDRRNSQRMRLPCLVHRLIHREVEHTRHGAHFLAHALTRTNKHGIDK